MVDVFFLIYIRKITCVISKKQSLRFFVKGNVIIEVINGCTSFVVSPGNTGIG